MYDKNLKVNLFPKKFKVSKFLQKRWERNQKKYIYCISTCLWVMSCQFLFNKILNDLAVTLALYTLFNLGIKISSTLNYQYIYTYI